MPMAETDLDRIGQLDKDHVLTRIAACENRGLMIHGVQVTYGVWSYGRVTDEVLLKKHGTDDEHENADCTALNLS